MNSTLAQSREEGMLLVSERTGGAGAPPGLVLCALVTRGVQGRAGVHTCTTIYPQDLGSSSELSRLMDGRLSQPGISHTHSRPADASTSANIMRHTRLAVNIFFFYNLSVCYYC